MTQVPASSHGVSSAGGTMTGPFTIDLSADVASRRALRVILPESFDFSVEAFTFEIENQFGLLGFTTTGAVSTKGNKLRSGGGAIESTGGTIRANASSGATVHTLDPTNGVGFYGTDPAAQSSAIANAAGGVVIDAEARTSLNSLLAAIRALGLIAT